MKNQWRNLHCTFSWNEQAVAENSQEFERLAVKQTIWYLVCLSSVGTTDFLGMVALFHTNFGGGMVAGSHLGGH